jgi:hypothetical protein
MIIPKDTILNAIFPNTETLMLKPQMLKIPELKISEALKSPKMLHVILHKNP